MRLGFLATFALVGCNSIIGIADVPPATRDVGVEDTQASALPEAGTTDTATNDATPTVPGARPPPRPTSSSTSSAPRRLAFAIRRFHLGTTAADDVNTADPEAWRRLGYDIDGVDTTAAGIASGVPGTCKRYTGAASNIQLDGNEGRDNSFGLNLFPLVNTWGGSKIESSLEFGITNASSPTILFILDGLQDGPDDTNVTLSTYLTSVEHPLLPRNWDGADTYAINELSLNSKSIEDPKSKLTKGYVSSHTFVSGDFNDPTGSVTFFMPLGPAGFVPVQLNAATFVIQLDDKHERAISATLSAVMEPKRLEVVLGAVSAKFLMCNPTFSDALRREIVRSCDLSLGEPGFLDTTGTKTCDAISIGIGFDLERVEVPTTTMPPVEDTTCETDAGADGG